MNHIYKPLISTIIPCYNPRFDLFKEAIESIMSQSYSIWETIIVNDGNNDEVRKSLENYISTLNDTRITFIHLDKNYGVAAARNKGVESSNGEIITFLSSDDLYLPWHHEEIVTEFSNNSNCCVLLADCLPYFNFFGIKIIHIYKTLTNFFSGKEKPEDILENLKKANRTLPHKLVLKKEVFNKIKFDPLFICAEDTDFILQILNTQELLNRVIISPLTSHLYRIYLSRKRLTHRGIDLFKSEEKIINKYNDKSSLAYSIIKHLQTTSNRARFHTLICDYLSNGSLLKHVISSLKTNKKVKGKISCAKSLIGITIEYKFLEPIFGVNLRYLSILQSKNINQHKRIKRIFHDYLNDSFQDEKAKFYAKKIYQKIL